MNVSKVRKSTTSTTYLDQICSTKGLLNPHFNEERWHIPSKIDGDCLSVEIAPFCNWEEIAPF